ncbi:hypothetical protein E2320_000796, partial [Naja naja]
MRQNAAPRTLTPRGLRDSESRAGGGGRQPIGRLKSGSGRFGGGAPAQRGNQEVPRSHCFAKGERERERESGGGRRAIPLRGRLPSKDVGPAEAPPLPLALGYQSVMDHNTFSHIQLWCPRPFGTYSENKPCRGNQGKKTFGDFACKAKEEEGDSGEVSSENTPPAPPPPPPPPAAASNPSQVEEGRVLLDTWYVIKPGNTKEKIAFFVAHQCSSGNRASAMKVKGNWGSDSSKAKRRRRSHDPARSKACPVKAKDGGSKEAEDVCLWPESHTDPAGGDTTDLLSVAEMVALVEQRTARAEQNYSRPSAPPSPMVYVSAEQEESGEKKAPTSGGSSDCSRVAEAIAHFESRERSVVCQNGLRRESAECVANSQHSPGEVRIAFPAETPVRPWSSSVPRPNCMFMSCGGSPTGTTARSKDKITCDLYQLISPSRDTLPNNVDFLLASASPKGSEGSGREPADTETTYCEAQNSSVKLDAIPEDVRAPAEKMGGSPASTARDCVSGFHVDGGHGRGGPLPSLPRQDSRCCFPLDQML